MDRRIIIVGFMGSGKSTVARALARRLNSKMVDLDKEIELADGRSPQRIIEEEDESGFREIETRVLTKVLKNETAKIIALGGGAWTLPSNRALIENDRAVSVWLDAPFELCWQRILNSGGKRPLARNESQARVLYEERRASYSAANLHIDASENKSTDQIASEIIQALQERDIR